MRKLYLLNFDGMQYGIWKDEVASVRDVTVVHRLPLSPACIAGIAVLDGRSTALADLAVCIGLGARPFSGTGRVLFVAGKEADSGFLVPGALDEAEAPPGAVFPLPGYLRTAESNTCVVRGSRPVPVINLATLYDRIHERAADPSVPSLSLPAVPQTVILELAAVRLFTAGGEVFSVPAAAISGGPVRPDSIAGLALAPRHVKGLAFHEGGVLPVIHLAERMGLPGAGGGGLMMAAEIAGERFGFLIDEDKGTLRGGEFVVQALPPVAATGWASAMVLSRGRLIPLLDPATVLGGADREETLKRLPEQYSPGSRFPLDFGQSSVDVVEFSLLGVRHALPKTEVEDIIPIKQYRKVPDALPIVIGVAEHNGEVLPVLDLALVFGRRSLETPEWKMVLIRNGDFRAFVITEAMEGGRMLPREVQRNVPIVLPHGLVYGCYPEGIAVRLVLNVFALAVHFDKSIVKDLLPALTREMAAAPAELVPSLLPEEHMREEAEALASLTAGAVMEMKAEETAAEPARQEAEAKAREEAEAPARMEEERVRREAEERTREEREARARIEAEEGARREAEEKAIREAEERTKREAEEGARREAEAQARLEAEERTRQEAEVRERLEAESRARIEVEERARRESEEKAIKEAEERARQEAEAEARAGEERARRDLEERARREAEEQTRLRAEQERASREAEERARAAAAAVKEAEEIKKEREESPVFAGAGRGHDKALSDSSSDVSSRTESPLQQDAAGWEKYLVAATVGLVLVSLIYFGAQRDAGVDTGRESAALKTDEGTKSRGSVRGPKKTDREGPLVLTVPADRPIEADIYIVRKGDTLWAICKRFTGNPLNYPRVARDNSIANPDLIFPGQKVHLKK